MVDPLARIVRTRAEEGAGGSVFRFGSGYLVAPGRVLTAAHVLVPPGRKPPAIKGQPCEIALGTDPDVWLPASVLWVGPDPDLAVIEANVGAGLPFVRFGRLRGSDLVPWRAVGYPVASLEEGGRQPEEAWGETSVITQAPAGKLGLTVYSRSPSSSADASATHASSHSELTTSGWAGLSGAAVFSGGRLVGVVITDPAGYERSLVARRPETVVDDPSLRDALGLRIVMEPVHGGALGAELRDLRVRLPDRVGSFTGREDELRWLAQAGIGPVVVAQGLAGLGGVGKTALALEYAHRCFYAEHSIDLVWWFPAADRLSLTSAMAGLYEQVTGTSTEQDSLAGAERLRSWLEDCPYRWLVVFDNTDEARVLDGLVPRAGQGQVLVTSRRRDWLQLGATVRTLGVLPADDAVTLLRRITGRDDDDGARLLAAELDGLAVALQ